jgi:hypothetical protein
MKIKTKPSSQELKIALNESPTKEKASHVQLSPDMFNNCDAVFLIFDPTKVQYSAYFFAELFFSSFNF